jgi:hypothetical protein
MSNKALKLAKAQAGTQARRPSSATRWPDGTPKSLGNDFTAHLDGRPSFMASPAAVAAFAHRATSTGNVERMRAMGIEPARISQLTHRPARPAKASA